MGGCRENPMPSPENYIVIKLGETEVGIARFLYVYQQNNLQFQTKIFLFSFTNAGTR